MKRLVIGSLLLISLSFSVSMVNSCTFMLPTNPYLSGLSLTDDNSKIITTIIDPSTNSKTNIVLNLDSKTIQKSNNETEYIPIPDNLDYFVNYSDNLVNSTTVENLTLHLYKNNTQILNVSLDNLGITFHYLRYPNGTIIPFYNTKYFYSHTYDRLYFFGDNSIHSISVKKPYENSYIIPYNNILNKMVYYQVKLQIYDNSSIIYYPTAISTDCEGYYYFTYNETNIWKVSSSLSYAVKTSKINPKIDSIVEIYGAQNRIDVLDLKGNIIFNWYIEQSQINKFINSSSSSFSLTSTNTISTTPSFTILIFLIASNVLILAFKRRFKS